MVGLAGHKVMNESGISHLQLLSDARRARIRSVSGSRRVYTSRTVATSRSGILGLHTGAAE